MPSHISPQPQSEELSRKPLYQTHQGSRKIHETVTQQLFITFNAHRWCLRSSSSWENRLGHSSYGKVPDDVFLSTLDYNLE
ncbi:hypothetical protein PHMEG_00016689 [Phytophthora megakarya]|uniref:Uncharacterized protein n=1 Tax=Phytophthora megakarya TaxID=4795 RepID=A0A225VY67_9STRA|nr:hypothetical protein PHMEG_00016689 [Phytophthora megakarya]